MGSFTWMSWVWNGGLSGLCYSGGSRGGNLIPSFSFFSSCPLSLVGGPFLHLFFFKDFIYLFMRDTQKEREAETQAEEKQAPCREPNVGLNPRTPGSHPGLKAGAKLLSHPGIPKLNFILANLCPYLQWKLSNELSALPEVKLGII